MPRPNTIPTVPIKLDKERHLKLDFNAIALIEEGTKKNVLKQESWESLTGSDIRVMLWAMLLDEDPEITLNDVGAMLHFGNIEYVFECIGKIADALSKDDEVKEGKERPLPKTS
jgi:hypothetical protein